MILSVLLLGTIGVISEKHLFKSGSSKKERLIFLLFLCFSLILSSLDVLHIHVPNILDGLTIVFHYPNKLLP